MTDNYQFKLESIYESTTTIIVKGIKFYHGYDVSDSISLNAISFSMPGQSSENNITINLGGFTQLITFNFILEDNGSDVSTTGDNIVTLKEQWNYILGPNGIVQDGGSYTTTELLYRITIYFIDSTGNGDTKTYTGMLQDIAIEPSEGEPRLRGRLTLNVAGSNPLAN